VSGRPWVRRRAALVVAAGLALGIGCVRLFPRWSAAPEASSPAAEAGSARGRMGLRRTFESLSAGQKMLVRMGPVNERRMKAKLKELRALVATGAVAKK